MISSYRGFTAWTRTRSLALSAAARNRPPYCIRGVAPTIAIERGLSILWIDAFCGSVQNSMTLPEKNASGIARISVRVLRKLIAAPFEGGAQTFLLSDFREFDADVRFCRIERSHYVEPGMHGIGEAHGVGAAVYGQLGMRERFR